MRIIVSWSLYFGAPHLWKCDLVAVSLGLGSTNTKRGRFREDAGGVRNDSRFTEGLQQKGLQETSDAVELQTPRCRSHLGYA